MAQWTWTWGIDVCSGLVQCIVSRPVVKTGPNFAEAKKRHVRNMYYNVRCPQQVDDKSNEMIIRGVLISSVSH